MITIVGVGALGSHVALLLRNEKIGLRLVDYDRIEQKNIQAQFHTQMSVGHNKARALAQAMQGLFGVKTDFFPTRVAATNIEVILRGSSLVIDCTDNLEARLLLIQECKRACTPCLHGALAASGDFAQVLWSEHFYPDSEKDKGGATCIDGEHLPFFVFASSAVASEAQHFLKTGKKSSYQLTPRNVIRVA
jgi:molybdopterin/thiamine biosynthesis adenylyltransferase